MRSVEPGYRAVPVQRADPVECEAGVAVVTVIHCLGERVRGSELKSIAERALDLRLQSIIICRSERSKLARIGRASEFESQRPARIAGAWRGGVDIPIHHLPHAAIAHIR